MDTRTLIDDLLEISVVASFSSIGYRLRHRLFDWQAPPAGVLRGRTALVTGPTSGLGRQTAEALADLGARVILVSRSRDRLAEVRDSLVDVHGEDRFPIVEADMSSLASVRSAVAQILERESRLDVLVDNAGAIYDERQLSPDGIEKTLATLAVGPFALTRGLLPLLRETGGSRVVAVTSGGMYTQPLDLDDLQLTAREYSGPRAYARAKRVQVVLMREWHRRLGASDITFSAMHPGWVDTPGLADSLPGFYRTMQPLLRDLEQGADTIVWLAADPAAAGAGGRLFLDRRPRPFDRLPSTRVTPADRRRLWDTVVALAGGDDPAG
jgi:dehydrogenase/reductase SDR family member 12